MIVIIDYEMGNTGSVKNAVESLGGEVVISRQKKDIKDASHIILPGVGAFGVGMSNLLEFGLVDVLENEVVIRHKPILGVCLGMQMFASVGEEGGIGKGLGWVGGRSRKFDVDDKKFRIPHIGWNDVSPKERSLLFRGIKTPIFYFVHSYHFVPEDDSVISAESEHGEKFVSAIEKGNIFGVQFHPEKSQQAGLGVLNNFLRI